MSSQYHLVTKKQEQDAKIPGTKGFCPCSEDGLPHLTHFDPGCTLNDIGSVCNNIVDHCYYLGTELGVRGLDPRRPTFLEEIYLLHDKISSLTRLASDLEDVTKNVTEIVQRQTSLEAILIAESQKNQQISSKKKNLKRIRDFIQKKKKNRQILKQILTNQEKQKKKKKNRQILKQILTNQEKHSKKLQFIESMNVFLFYFFILFFIF
jgi:uncharacterized protein YgiM (DUF1202 family)